MLVKNLLLAGAAALGLALPAHAATPRLAPAPSAPPVATFHDEVTPIQQVQISALQAIDMVRRAYGGEPMGAPSLERNGGRAVYVIRWRFPNEVVDVVRVDAVSGQIFR